MNNEELLKLAASAAGIEIVTWSVHKDKSITIDIATWQPWNPLVFDQDAFRLMVELGIGLSFGQIESTGNMFIITKRDKRRKTIFRCGEDEPTIIRRAIVKAAAKVD